MSKKLGFWSIVLLTINSIIGTGIFLSPGSVAKLVGSYAPLIYTLAAVFTICLALTFAAAAKYVNKPGAGYAYTKAAFGDNVGFYVGITRYVAASIAWGVMATAVIKTAMKILGIEQTNTNILLGFVVLMSILFIISLLGTNVVKFFSNVSTLGKLFALVFTIVAGFVLIFKTGQNHLLDLNTFVVDGAPFIKPLDATIVVTAIISAFYAFTGFESVASGSADMEKPEKNLPRAIPLAIVIIAIVYVGIVFMAMTLDSITLATSKDAVVLASVFKNPLVKQIIVYGALVSMFGINIAASFHTPRIIEAMSREGQVPKIFKVRMLNDVPVFAFLLTAVFSVVIPIVFSFNMGSIIIISSISRFVQFILVPIAVIYFFYDRSHEKILKANKNKFTDVVLPLISLVLTAILLIKFNWVGQFTKVVNGVSIPNYSAIYAMVIGYVILPIALFIYQKFTNK